MITITSIDFDNIIFNLREGNYKYIGSGSGRRVFDLENGYVVKVAKNRKGLAQNEAEYQISKSDNSDLFAKILQVSENFTLLIMEKADRINNFNEVLLYFHVKNNRELFQLENINYIFKKYNLLPVDLIRPANWGVIKNRYVIIDYGFTRSIRKRYYSLF